MGAAHFFKLGFQLADIPLHFLYGGSEETKTSFWIQCNQESMQPS